MLRTSCLLVVLGGCAGCGDDTPPTVVSVTPADGAAELWLHDPITVTFSESIDRDSVTPTSVVVTAEDGTALPSAATIDGSVMKVVVAADAATRGGVRLSLTSGITDESGNALADTSVSWTLPAWTRVEQQGAAPSLAIGDDGRLVIARSSGGRILVAELGANGWVPLGGELGTDASAPAVSFDAEDRPIVVWSELALEAARWDGSAWQPLASPGDGQFPAAARVPGGDPTIVYSLPGSRQNAVVRVRRLVGDAWEAVGDDIVTNAALAAQPQLAMAEAPVLAFGEGSIGTGTLAQPALRVFRFGGAWQELPQLPLGLAPNGELESVSVALRGSEIFVAYDPHSKFSFGVYVVRFDGQAWSLVGGALDVDPPADARQPTVAIDADGTPFVAWRELVEDSWRGLIARWDGAAWRALGGGAWNDDPLRAIDRPAMVLAGAHAPVVAWQDGALVRVARWNGPVTPDFGINARTSIAGCTFDGTQTTLSATGCFTIANGHATPHAGLIPFDIVSELWSDGARKRRWIALPDGQMLTTPSTGAWTAPPGTMLIKEFAIETTPGDPRTRRVMETRFLIAGGTGVTEWRGFSFQWRQDGSDADILPDVATTVDWPLDNGTTHTHSYPSRQNCLRCHHPSNGPLLGLRTGQLARRFDYGGVMADQLETLAHIGVIAMPSDVQPFASPHDPSRSLEERMRGYVAANCAHCHNPTGERPTRDFRWETPLAATMLCGTDLEVVAGDAASSVMYQRISTRVNGMPPLATLQTDPLAIDVIGRWIQTETNCQ